jgi:hypothetical protein
MDAANSASRREVRTGEQARTRCIPRDITTQHFSTGFASRRINSAVWPASTPDIRDLLAAAGRTL